MAEQGAELSAAASGPEGEIAAPAPRPLPVLRTLIDSLDSQIVRLLNARASVVVEVGLTKAKDGTPVYAPYREQAVLAKVLAQNTGPLLPITLESVYREIMSGAFALERPLRIGYLGPPGSFSHEASVRQFGNSVSYENLRTIDGVFEEVARGHVDYGLVPVENALVGAVAETADGFLNYVGRVSVVAEVQLSVCHSLIAAPGAVPSDVTEVHSKPEALGQCRRWLATQYPQATLVNAPSTSAAVQKVAQLYAEGGTSAAKHVASIGSSLAARLHDLPVMFADVQDFSPNITRFFVLCSSATPASAGPASGDDKTAALFVTDDRPGALAMVLDAFRKHAINLTHIDKRPCSPQLLAHLVSVSARKRAVGATAHTGPGGEEHAGQGGGSTAGEEDRQRQAGLSGMGSGRPPSPLSMPLITLAPSLFVPAMLGGRGGLTSSFTYAFIIEASGHVDSEHVKAALEEASSLCVALKVLGSYPRARRVL